MHQMKSTSQVKVSSLKAERELRGWSQAKIAELLGTTTKTVGRWERGEAVPYPHYREQLCELFGKNAQQLGWLQEEEERMLPMPELEESDLEGRVSAMTEPWSLQDPAIPQVLVEVKQLLGRSTLFLDIKESLLAADGLSATALTGLAGMGKTTLVAALAADQQVHDHFVDGILWAGLGPSANVLSQLMRWGKLLGVTAAQVGDIKSQQAWGQALRESLGSRRLLVIIDDAWTIEEAQALQVGGPGCVHVLTTQQPQIASAFAQRRVLVAAPLEDADGLALLASFIPQVVQQDPEGARKLVWAVEGLPLALTLMGKYLACQVLRGQSQLLRTTLAQFYETQERLQIRMSDRSGEQTGRYGDRSPLGLYASIAFCDQYVSPRAHAALCALSLLASKPESFSKEAALGVSQQSMETIDELIKVGLLQSWGADRYRVHQSVADYVGIQQEILGGEKQVSAELVEERQRHHWEPYSLREPLPLPGMRISHTRTRSTWWSQLHVSWLPLLTLSTTLLAVLAIVALLLAYTQLSSSSIIEQVPHTPIVQFPSGTSYEAEAPDNTLDGGARIIKCLSCSGRKKMGYIGLDKKKVNIGVLQFNKIREKNAGDYMLTVYYIAGSTGRVLDVSVNGGPTVAYYASSTKSWNVVGTLGIPIHLNAGYNSIKFFSRLGRAPDIDRIIV